MLAAPRYDVTLSTARGAWGLRQLISTYSGPLIRIRDSSGGAQQDVGQDVNGNLASFTVTGDPYIVKVYDQSGNGCDIGQPTTSLQPRLFLNVTPRGGPGIKFDGIDDYLVDPTAATNRAYMVTNPIWIIEHGQSTPNEDWATIVQIPHSAGFNTSPFCRIAYNLFSNSLTDSNITFNATGTQVHLEGFTRESGWLVAALNVKGGFLHSGLDQAGDWAKSGTTVTYPFSTNLIIGANGAFGENWGGYFCGLVIIDNASPNATTIRTAIRAAQSSLFMPFASGWRIKTNTNFNGSDLSQRFSEWAWALSSGGTNLATTINQSWASRVNSTEYEFLLTDGSTATSWSSGNAAGPHYVGIAFPSRKDILELKLTAGNAFANLMPKQFTLQYVDDDGGWIDHQTYDLTAQGNAVNQVYTLVVPAIASVTITGVSPSSGITSGGTSVTITGTNLTGTTDVKFGGTSATSIVVVNSTTITCDTPAHAAGAVDVQVFNPAGNPTLVNGYTYLAATLTSISPNFGALAGGTAVTLTGTLFTGATDVKFDGTSATSIVVVNSTTITCNTPAHAAGLVDVQVFTPLGNPTLVNGFSYADALVRITQVPILTLDISNQKVRTTQVPLLVLYQEKQPNRVTQVPALVLYTPKPVPLPMPVVPETPMYETWGWITALNPSQVGQEQRSRLRSTPRYTLEIAAIIDSEEDRVTIYNMLMRYLKTPFNYPMFQYNARLTQAALIGDTKLYCNMSFTDVRDDEVIALFDPRSGTITYLTVTTVDSDGVNLLEPLEIDVPMNWQLCPVLEFRIIPVVGLSMVGVSGGLSLTMESMRPRVFQRPGAAPSITTIDNIVIIPQRPLADSDVNENFDMGNTWFDNTTSIPDVLNEWSNPHTMGNRQYKFDRRTGIDYWRAICDGLKGRQGVALFPTFRDDLKLRDPMALSATTFTTDNINFFTFWLDVNYRYIALFTANGTIYRRVIDVAPHYNSNGDPDYITVKLDQAIGGSAGDNTIAAISYMNLCRLDTDDVKLTHTEIDTLIDFTIKAVDK